uniref:Uncharacterized protein n=1 Tax=Arundo donax TaxID=35708 RepID=A0A0A9TSE5_ARUDO
MVHNFQKQEGHLHYLSYYIIALHQISKPHHSFQKQMQIIMQFQQNERSCSWLVQYPRNKTCRNQLNK